MAWTNLAPVKPENAKQPRPDHKVSRKLVPLDAETDRRLRQAALLVGLPATGFIRLALHRAFEGFLGILTSMVDQEAQGWVESRAKGFYRTVSKRGIPRLAPGDNGEFDKLLRRLADTNVTPAEARRGVARAFRKRTPRGWGAPRYAGSPYEQALVKSLLEDNSAVSTSRNLLVWSTASNRRCMDLLADIYCERAEYHADQWRELPRLQAAVAKSLLGDTKELKRSYERDLINLQNGFHRLQQGRKPEPDFLQCLENAAAHLHTNWSKLSAGDRRSLVQRRIRVCETRIKALTTQDERAARELEKLQDKPELWLNPWVLRRWLEASRSPDQVLRPARFP